MARASKKSGKKSKTIGSKPSPAAGRRTAKAAAKPRIAAEDKPSKRQSFAELEARFEFSTRELDQALEQQKATAEVLDVISSSSGELPLVFDTVLDKAMHLCGAEFAVLANYDGKTFRTAATRGLPKKCVSFRAHSSGDYGPGTAPFQHLQGEPFVHILDLMNSDAYRAGQPNRRALVDLGGARCLLCVPLLSDREVIGGVLIFRQEACPCNDQQFALLVRSASIVGYSCRTSIPSLLHPVRGICYGMTCMCGAAGNAPILRSQLCLRSADLHIATTCADCAETLRRAATSYTLWPINDHLTSASWN